MSIQSRSIIGECANCGKPLAPCDLDEHTCAQPAQDNQEAAEQAADECAKEKWVHEPTTEKAVRYGFLAGAKWQKAEFVKDEHEEIAHLRHMGKRFTDEITALKQQVAELRGVIELTEDEYVRQVGTWKIIQRLECERDEATEALGMSSKRNGQLSDRVKELELEEPSLRAANECNRKCLAQLAKAEKREREAVAALESIAMMARVKPTYNDYQLRIDMEDLANAALAAFPSPCE